jgi:3',5'-cyclic AMP phosphodiesterase CpdA
MTRLQAQAAALAAAALLMLLVLIIAIRSSEQSSTQPDTPAPPPETPEQKAAREAAKPGPNPDRIILTWKGDPTTTQAVTWRTDTSVSRASAQIALADSGPGVEQSWKGFEQKKVGQFPARTELLKTAMNEAHYHSVNFEGLRPATRYMYRVGDGAAWSEWFQFDTASTTPEPFGFIYFGDAQNGIKSLWSRVVRGAYSALPRARFIIHAGDLVNSGNNDAEWGEWHSAAGWINGVVPSVPAPGNHEFGGKLIAHWRPQFTLPENGPPGLEETCYYFDFQGTRIIVLNSNEKIAEQVPWLERVLESRPGGIRWTIVTFHHPVYSTSPGRDNKVVRQMWRPIFDKYGVDLVLQGHDHSYGRSGLMRDDKLLSGEQLSAARGTVYVVSVSGTKMYALDKLSWAPRSAANLQLYQLVRIDGGVLKYESHTASGELFDEFELRKRPDGGTDLSAPPLPPSAALEVPSWPAVAPLVVRPAVNSEPEAAPATAPEGSREYGRGLAAAIILGSVVLGVAAAIRAGGRKPRGV